MKTWKAELGDDAEFLETGDEYTLQIVEIKEKWLHALPEFEGF